jgi:hypothetical protein
MRVVEERWMKESGWPRMAMATATAMIPMKYDELRRWTMNGYECGGGERLVGRRMMITTMLGKMLATI